MVKFLLLASILISNHEAIKYDNTDKYDHIIYTVKYVKGGEYYAEKKSGEGLYFLEENINPGTTESIDIGDEIVGVFKVGTEEGVETVFLTDNN
jgi:hypothetical protein